MPHQSNNSNNLDIIIAGSRSPVGTISHHARELPGIPGADGDAQFEFNVFKLLRYLSLYYCTDLPSCSFTPVLFPTNFPVQVFSQPSFSALSNTLPAYVYSGQEGIRSHNSICCSGSCKMLFRSLCPVFRPFGHVSDESQTSLVSYTGSHW